MTTNSANNSAPGHLNESADNAFTGLTDTPDVVWLASVRLSETFHALASTTGEFRTRCGLSAFLYGATLPVAEARDEGATPCFECHNPRPVVSNRKPLPYKALRQRGQQ